ncbi:GIY-YIG nuclease family protein [Candidatus Wolfebacteria bacterium]|nr:GIY-YIG nuclease family protein [Candidatus Wolfebacteria bacterium]
MKSSLKVKNFSKGIPSASGVYFFIGKKSEILYIGRATNLRRRVVQYFQKSLDPRIGEMVSLAKEIKFKKTKNLLEAIILEANLIKKHWPKYNVKDKDDRSFIYIVIPKNVDFPAPMIIRGHEIKNLTMSAPCLQAGRGRQKLEFENYHIFGPYQSLLLIKNALKIIRRIFPYSDCKGKFTIRVSGSESLSRIFTPCFNYQIGLCPGVCVGAISKKDYQKNINNIILLLKGERKKLIEKLKKENPDKAKALNHVQDVSLMSDFENMRVSKFKRIEGYDVSHLSGKETVGSMAVFSDGESDKSQYRKFIIKKAGNNDLLALEEMISRRFNHKEWLMPDLILIDGGLPQIRHISKILKNINIEIPAVGISKFGDDKLVFKANIGKGIRESISQSKSVLLKLRDEAHRFAISFSRKKRRIF